MRVLLGMVLGGALTVGGAYLYDSHTTPNALDQPARAERPLVNWDVVGAKWHDLTERAIAEWHQRAG